MQQAKFEWYVHQLDKLLAEDKEKKRCASRRQQRHYYATHHNEMRVYNTHWRKKLKSEHN